MGSSTAYHLAAHPGFSGRILVVDKDMTYRQAASSLSLSSIRQQFSSPINIRVGLYGVAFLRQARDLLAVDGEAPDLSLTENGYLYLASEAGAPILAANHATQIAEGADILLLTPDALQARFPFLNGEGIAAAAWGRSGEGWFDGYMLTQAFRRKARSLGVALSRRRDRFDRARRRPHRRRAAGEWRADRLRRFVNAAGASGAARLARQMGRRNSRSFAQTLRLPVQRQGAHREMPAGDRRQRRLCAHGSESYICGISPPEAEDPDCDDFDVIWPQFEDVIWPALAHRIPAFENLRPAAPGRAITI